MKVPPLNSEWLPWFISACWLLIFLMQRYFHRKTIRDINEDITVIHEGYAAVCVDYANERDRLLEKLEGLTIEYNLTLMARDGMNLRYQDLQADYDRLKAVSLDLGTKVNELLTDIQVMTTSAVFMTDRSANAPDRVD